MHSPTLIVNLVWTVELEEGGFQLQIGLQITRGWSLPQLQSFTSLFDESARLPNNTTNPTREPTLDGKTYITW